jgi:uncharacterized membrane protein YhiD involved in acid resistance
MSKRKIFLLAFSAALMAVGVGIVTMSPPPPGGMTTPAAIGLGIAFGAFLGGGAILTDEED